MARVAAAEAPGPHAEARRVVGEQDARRVDAGEAVQFGADVHAFDRCEFVFGHRDSLDEVERRGHRYAEARDGARAGFLHAGSQRAVPRGENLLRRLVFGDFDFGVGLPDGSAAAELDHLAGDVRPADIDAEGVFFVHGCWFILFVFGIRLCFALSGQAVRPCGFPGRIASPARPHVVERRTFSFRSRAVSPGALRNIASKDTKITGTAAIPPFAQVVQ